MKMIAGEFFLMQLQTGRDGPCLVEAVLNAVLNVW